MAYLEHIGVSDATEKTLAVEPLCGVWNQFCCRTNRLIWLKDLVSIIYARFYLYPWLWLSSQNPWDFDDSRTNVAKFCRQYLRTFSARLKSRLSKL